MKGMIARSRHLRVLLLGLLLVGFVVISAGCQVDIGGQTLPSPYYLSDDVRYSPPGSEFPLAREAAALAEQAQQQAPMR